MSPTPDPILQQRVASLPFGALDGFRDRECARAADRVLALEERVAGEARTLEGALHTEAGPASAPAASGPVAIELQAPARSALLQARRDVHNRRRLRIERAARAIAPEHPSLAERLERFGALLDELDTALVTHRARHEQAIARGAAELVRLERLPLVREGLRLVGRGLAIEAAKLDAAPPTRWAHRQRYVALKLFAYLTRFATKTSPNGVFCATALGGFAERASCVGDNAIVRRETLAAVGEARKITACLAADPALTSMVSPRVNPTLRVRDGAWTFWRPASPRNEDDDEVLSSMRVHPVVQGIVDACAPGRTLPDMIAEASRRTGVSPADLEALARRLATLGLLIAEVEIPWSERRPLARLAAEVRGARCSPPWLEPVEALEREIGELDALSWDERRARLDGIADRAEALPHRRPLDHDALLRVDVSSGLQVELPRRVFGELERALQWYARLCATLYPRAAVFDSVARRFLARFPADHDVEALDVYHDVFEDRGDERAAAFPPPGGASLETGERRRAFEAVRDVFVHAARDALREGREDVALEELDWDAVLGDAHAPSWACGVLFQLAARDLEAVDKGQYRLVLNSIYPGGGLASARLAHLHAGGGPIEDSALARELRAHWEPAAGESTIAAEVSFMHGARTANAGLRPSLFRHEIELPGDRATPGREVLPLSDLVVRYDSAARRFSLRSRARGVEVRPVVSSGISAHGMVAFLVAVGQQDLQPLPYFPGFDVPDVAHWPRFTLGRTVIFRRRWTIPVEPPAGDRAALDPRHVLEVARWRRRYGLPRHVFAHTSAEPKPFAVDLESPWAVGSLWSRLEEGSATPMRFTEMLPGPDELWVADARGRYASEWLVHLRGTGPAALA